jgi:hypothetical protein
VGVLTVLFFDLVPEEETTTPAEAVSDSVATAPEEAATAPEEAAKDSEGDPEGVTPPADVEAEAAA